MLFNNLNVDNFKYSFKLIKITWKVKLTRSIIEKVYPQRSETKKVVNFLNILLKQLIIL